MSILQLPKGSAVDNSPDAPACPPWLLLLDDPEPASVLFVGDPDRATEQWFLEVGAKVSVRPPSGGSAPADVVVVAAPSRRTLNRRHALAAERELINELATEVGPHAALVLPWPVREATTTVLASHGFAVLRPIQPILGRPARKRGAAGYVTLRDAENGSVAADPPRWLATLSRGQTWAPGPGGWSLRVPSAYPSQKAVVTLAPTPTAPAVAVLKLTRHPRFNERLDNEFTQLRQLATSGGEASRRAPAALAAGQVAGMTAVVEEAVGGLPFLDSTTLKPDCPLATSAVEAITALGSSTALPLSGQAFSGPLTELLDRFVVRNNPPDVVAGFLAEQIAVLADHEVPGVLFHGDLGTWNLMAKDGFVRILDWESAEAPGPPLWDLAYFVRSFAVRAGRRRGLDRDRAIDRNLVASSPFNQAATVWFRNYADQVGVTNELLAPLFHLGWMHRAVKESNRLEPDRPGHYGPLCTRLVLARNRPGLRSLLSQ